MLPEPLQISLDLLIQFTGDGGGHRPAIVPYGIGALIWYGLLQVALFKSRPVDDPHESLLVLGFAIALGRELFMLSVKILEAFSLVSLDNLHIVFPPAEHALSDISTVVVIGAFILYLSGEDRFARRYMLAGIATIIAIYLATFLWWADFITTYPESKFGQTWCDWAFRINASLWFTAGGVYLWLKAEGWRRNLVCIAIGFFFLDDFLKIPDMALGEVHEAVFAPIRHVFYFLGIILLGYIYLRGHASSLLESYHSLEVTIKERTDELARANRQLMELASKDALTGIGNRRAFDHDFNLMRASVSRAGGSIAVLLIDIDHFKLVNDTYGHPAGDECLRIIGKILSATFKRDDDIVARYGGEEFVVVVAREPFSACREHAEKLRQQIEASPVEFEGQRIELTASIGIAHFDSSSRDVTESLIALADGALYDAKASGRNRVCVASGG